MTTRSAALMQELAESLVLGSLLDRVRARWGSFDILDHWQQGEFHHDLVLRVAAPTDLPGPYLVVATNCNGGVKEVLCLAELPARGGLWHARCPDNPEFEGHEPEVLECARTVHWFSPSSVFGLGCRRPRPTSSALRAAELAQMVRPVRAPAPRRPQRAQRRAPRASMRRRMEGALKSFRPCGLSFGGARPTTDG